MVGAAAVVIPRRLLPQTIQVAAYLGGGAQGDVWSPPVSAPARVELEQTMVRGTDGAELLSSATAYVRPSTVAPIGSRVTLPDGSQRRVLVRSEHVGRRRVELVSLHLE